MWLFDIVGLYSSVLGTAGSVSLPLPEKLKVGGDWQFLTNWGVLITSIFAILNIILPNYNTQFYHLISSIECNITISYWSTILLSPSSLNTDSYNVPLLLDLKIHLFPYLYLFFLVDKPAISFINSVLLSTAFTLVYWAYINYLMYNNPGYAPYPVLKDKTHLQKSVKLVQWILLSQVNYILQLIKYKLIN